MRRLSAHRRAAALAYRAAGARARRRASRASGGDGSCRKACAGACANGACLVPPNSGILWLSSNVGLTADAIHLSREDQITKQMSQKDQSTKLPAIASADNTGAGAVPAVRQSSAPRSATGTTSCISTGRTIASRCQPSTRDLGGHPREALPPHRDHHRDGGFSAPSWVPCSVATRLCVSVSGLWHGASHRVIHVQSGFSRVSRRRW